MLLLLLAAPPPRSSQLGRTMAPPSRAECEAMDAADALRHVRPRFALPEGTIYLDGNSLGPLPRGVTERVTEVIEREWGRDLITSWNKNGWMDHPLSAGRKIARLVGGGEGNVVVADSTSVNLFKVLGAALALRPGRTRIISETGNFPTDLYMIQGMVVRSHSLPNPRTFFFLAAVSQQCAAAGRRRAC